MEEPEQYGNINQMKLLIDKIGNSITYNEMLAKELEASGYDWGVRMRIARSNIKLAIDLLQEAKEELEVKNERI